MNDEQLLTFLGSAVFETHGEFFKELIDNGYDITHYYDGGSRWGDVSKILAMVSYIRGVRSYADYLAFYEAVKQPDDGGALSSVGYARVTGVKREIKTQTERTRRYRQRQADELRALRESTALKWIDENTEKALLYIRRINKTKKSIDKL